MTEVFPFHIGSVALFAELIIYKLSARARYLKSKSIIIILRHLNIYGGLKEIFMELSVQVMLVRERIWPYVTWPKAVKYPSHVSSAPFHQTS